MLVNARRWRDDRRPAHAPAANPRMCRMQPKTDIKAGTGKPYSGEGGFTSPVDAGGVQDRGHEGEKAEPNDREDSLQPEGLVRRNPPHGVSAWFIAGRAMYGFTSASIMEGRCGRPVIDVWGTVKLGGRGRLLLFPLLPHKIRPLISQGFLVSLVHFINRHDLRPCTSLDRRPER
jgi:hypothetical protein